MAHRPGVYNQENKWVSCHLFLPQNICQQEQKQNTYIHNNNIDWSEKHCWLKEVRYKGKHNVWFHVYEFQEMAKLNLVAEIKTVFVHGV